MYFLVEWTLGRGICNDGAAAEAMTEATARGDDGGGNGGDDGGLSDGDDRAATSVSARTMGHRGYTIFPPKVQA